MEESRECSHQYFEKSALLGRCAGELASPTATWLCDHHGRMLSMLPTSAVKVTCRGRIYLAEMM